MRWPLAPLHAYVAASLGRCVHRTDDCPGCFGFGATPAFKRCVSQVQLAEQLGVNVRTVQRWVTEGLNDQMADRCAVAAGTHASRIWGPEWDRAALTPLDELFVNGSETAEPGWRHAALWASRPSHTCSGCTTISPTTKTSPGYLEVARARQSATRMERVTDNV